MEKLPNILITGLARNVEKILPLEVNRLYKIASIFYNEVRFHLIESDSQDSTTEVLDNIASSMPDFSFQSLGQLQHALPDRISRLRYCRNKYVEFIRRQSTNFTHVMVVDFDIRNRKFDKTSVERILNEEMSWDAFFANQAGRYFDIFALRENEWCPQDCMNEVAELTRLGMSRKSAKERAIWGKMKNISVTNRPIAVESAFGGMAIYRSWIFDSFDYSIESTPVLEHESEHVALHYKAKSAGAHLFIHPGLINFSWNPHNLASFKLLRYLDQITTNPFLQGFRSKMRSLLG